MNHLALFNGIGGFQLAASWLGWNNVAHVEIDSFCNKVVAYHFPNSICHTDIKQFDGTPYRGTIDIISGGFPCQPFSAAGKRKGTEDDRHLWPEMLRTIREIQPGWVVGENVRGLTNWDGGMVFDQVQADMETLGYQVLPFLLPACAVNAPHRRDRIWFVAHSENNGHGRRNQLRERNGFGERGVYEHSQDGRDEIRTITERSWESGTSPNPNSPGDTSLRCGVDRKQSEISSQREQSQHEYNRLSDKRNVTNPKPTGLGRENRFRLGGTKQPAECVTTDSDSRRQPRKEHRQKKSGFLTEKSIPNDWQNFPTQPPICSRNDGLSSRLSGITFPKHRNESIKALGNSIVPQIAYEIFKVIDQMDNL